MYDLWHSLSWPDETLCLVESYQTISTDLRCTHSHQILRIIIQNHGFDSNFKYFFMNRLSWKFVGTHQMNCCTPKCFLKLEIALRMELFFFLIALYIGEFSGPGVFKHRNSWDAFFSRHPYNLSFSTFLARNFIGPSAVRNIQHFVTSFLNSLSKYFIMQLFGSLHCCSVNLFPANKFWKIAKKKKKKEGKQRGWRQMAELLNFLYADKAVIICVDMDCRTCWNEQGSYWK